MAIKYWVGASNHGHLINPKYMFDDFIQNKYWATDLNLNIRTNKNVSDALKTVKVNDRIAVSSMHNRYQDVHIRAIGTVTGTDQASKGRLEVDWDEDQKLFQGTIPLGTKNENWQQALFQTTTTDNISLVFPDAIINKKVARLAWNELGWLRPSGVNGKGSLKDTHEGQFGYGHEEWLFDTSKVIDGYHYGFLEPIRKGQAAHANKTYPIWLYSINGLTKKRYWVGEIKKVTVINEAEASSIKEKYKELKWLKQMANDIVASGGSSDGFSDYAGADLFNVKFRPEDLMINKEPIELGDDHPANKITKYSLANFTEAFIVEK